ncbi:Ubiquitin-conjugating enzyme E2 2 [Bienertia sinuspersici]
MSTRARKRSVRDFKRLLGYWY